MGCRILSSASALCNKLPALVACIVILLLLVALIGYVLGQVFYVSILAPTEGMVR